MILRSVIDLLTIRAPRRVRLTRMVQFNVLLAVFPIMAVFAYRKALAERSWRATPCIIVASGVDFDPGEFNAERPYRATITFQYIVDGELIDGHDDERRSSDRGTLDARVERFPMGMKTVCWVDPTDAHRSVVERDSIVFPIIVFVGFAIVLAALWWWVWLPLVRGTR